MDNSIMLQWMQMMMQQNQMMTQLMMTQLSNPNGVQPVPEAPSLEISTTTSSNVPENQSINNSEVAALQAQVAALQAQVKQLQSDLAAAQHTADVKIQEAKMTRETSKELGTELRNLKKTVRKAEEYLGKSIDELAENVQELGGDDYYEEHKKEWNDEGLTGKEKHDKVKSYRDLFKDDNEEEIVNMIDF